MTKAIPAAEEFSGALPPSSEIYSPASDQSAPYITQPLITTSAMSPAPASHCVICHFQHPTNHSRNTRRRETCSPAPKTQRSASSHCFLKLLFKCWKLWSDVVWFMVPFFCWITSLPLREFKLLHWRTALTHRLSLLNLIILPHPALSWWNLRNYLHWIYTVHQGSNWVLYVLALSCFNTKKNKHQEVCIILNHITLRLHRQIDLHFFVSSELVGRFLTFIHSSGAHVTLPDFRGRTTINPGDTEQRNTRRKKQSKDETTRTENGFICEQCRAASHLLLVVKAERCGGCEGWGVNMWFYESAGEDDDDDGERGEKQGYQVWHFPLESGFFC